MTANDTANDHVYVRLQNLGVDIEKLRGSNLSVKELSNLASSLEELMRHYQTLRNRLTTIEN